MEPNAVLRRLPPSHHSAGRMAGRRTAVAAAALAAGLGLASSAAAAVVKPPPQRPIALTAACGTELNAAGNTYVLQNDVGPCASDGIDVVANGITLDLNGHEIKGMPRTASGGFGEGVGVRLIAVSRVTVTNRKAASDPSIVSDFDAGLVVQGDADGAVSSLNTVKALQLENNVGSQPFGGGGACGDPTAPACEVSDFNDGLVLVGAVNNTIGPGNVLRANGSGGIRIDDSANDNVVKGNLSEGNGGNGIRFLTGAGGNVVKNNTSRNNAFSGVSVSFTSPSNTIQANILEGNAFFGVATSFEADGTVIEENTIAANRAGGITLGSAMNTVAENKLVDNGRGASGTGRGNGIFVGSGTDNFPRVGTIVTENSVTGSGGNGIRVGCMIDQDPNDFSQFGCLVYDTHDQIKQNVATGNAVNGPPGTQVKQGFQVTGFYDLLDSTNTLATQSPFDPSGRPLTDCGNNTWVGNTFSTAFPACTTTPDA